MAQRINPISYRLGKSASWKLNNIVFHDSDSSYFLSEQLIIQKLVKLICAKFNIFISDVNIIRSPKHIVIQFMFYPDNVKRNKQKENLVKINIIFKYIKYLLSQYFNIPVYFKTCRIPSVVLNAQILSAFLNDQIHKNPRKYKLIFKKLIKEYYTWYKIPQK